MNDQQTTVNPLTRRAIIITVALLVLVGLTAIAALGVRSLWLSATSSTLSPSCTAGDYQLDTDQAAVASTMVGVVINRGLPERAAVLVLAAALQESKLHNLASGDGDRDSVGVLQQRPSQGWGTIAQLNDLHYATGKFLDKLLEQSDWQTRDLAEAIQDVQISADGSLYAQHEGEAQALADALTGATPAGINCQFPTPSQVATPEQVSAAVRGDLPVSSPTIDGVHGSVTVSGAGWATAAWFVANANRLGLDSVSYAQRTWSRSKGWRTDDAAGASTVVAVLHE